MVSSLIPKLDKTPSYYFSEEYSRVGFESCLGSRHSNRNGWDGLVLYLRVR
jgi:hypothetical protein